MEGEAEPPSLSGLRRFHFWLLILLHQQLLPTAGNMATNTSSSKMPKDAVDSCKNVVASDGPSSSPQRSGSPGDGYVCLGWREPIFWSHMVYFASLSTVPAFCGILHLGLLGLIWSRSTSPPFQGLQVPSRAQTRWKDSQMLGDKALRTPGKGHGRLSSGWECRKMKLVIPAAGFSAGVHAGAGWDGSS